MSCFGCGLDDNMDNMRFDFPPSNKEVEEDAAVVLAAQKMNQARMERVLYRAEKENQANPNSNLQGRVQKPVKVQSEGVLSAFSSNGSILMPLPEDNHMQRDPINRDEFTLENSFAGSSESPAFRNPLYKRFGTGKFNIVEKPVEPSSPKAIYFDTEQTRVEETVLKSLCPSTTKQALFEAEVSRAAAQARGDNDGTLKKMGKAVVTKGPLIALEHIAAIYNTVANG